MDSGAGVLFVGSNDSLLTMLVPWVLGDKGILPVVALVACEAQSPTYGKEPPSVFSLHLCLVGQ